MQTANQMTIQCPSCGQPFNAAVQTLVDVGKNPNTKALLMTGQFNMAQCPHCGAKQPPQDE